MGRRAVHALSVLDSEFVGDALAPWPALVARLACSGVVTAKAAELATLLYAFGLLIGNADMHNGNLSFVAEQGKPYEMAPAYDMLPMAFRPGSGGDLPDSLNRALLPSCIPLPAWRQALVLAESYLARMGAQAGCTPGWMPCLAALRRHVEDARQSVARLA